LKLNDKKKSVESDFDRNSDLDEKSIGIIDIPDGP
jgi:hypothetical protein